VSHRDRLLGLLGFFAGWAVTLAVIDLIDAGDVTFSFIAGAILGTQIPAWSLGRRSDDQATLADRLGLGLILGAAAVIAAVLTHQAIEPMEFPEVVIPISAVGAALFPLFLFETFSAPMRRARSNSSDS
jgi:hypothetical protein